MDRRTALMTPLMGSVALMVGGKAEASPVRPQAEPATKPKRINKCIELLEQGQPIYVTIGFGGYEEGKKMAQTIYDMIVYDMEHKPLNLVGLEAFMRGLKDGGPTKSGHLTPTVVPQLPAGGWEEAEMAANYWMVHQCLDTGAHGIYLCHAGDPGAVRVVVRSARYPFDRIGIDPEVPEGRRDPEARTRPQRRGIYP